MRKGALLLVAVVAVFFWAVLSVQVQSQGGGQVQLPEGPGKALVQASCTACHGLNSITNSWGYTREGWELLFSSMVAFPKVQADVVADYLATNFPEKPAPAAVLIPGGVSVSIREWMLPSLGSRPHDPLATPDGAIWWTGMWANVIGRLDPDAGAMGEYPLPTPQSGPHGLVADGSGNIWFTANSKTYIGKLDPNTGEVTEYPLPDPAARGPHTPISRERYSSRCRQARLGGSTPRRAR